MASASAGFEIKDLKFFDVNGKQQKFPVIMHIQYEEDIFLPFVYASLIVNDSSSNILASLPIQGGEKIELTVATGDGTFEYSFVIFDIAKRTSTERVQLYNLQLISEAALMSESIRPREIFIGRADEIAANLLTNSEYLGIDSTKIFLEQTQFKTKLIADGTRNPFNIINQLAYESVPEKSTFSTNNTNVKSGESKQSTGTSGYLFYENREGYHFKSVDRLCARRNNDAGFEGDDPVAKYIYSQSNTGTEQDDVIAKFSISEYSFDREINVLDNLRKGTYSSMYCYYNVSTGKYEEYQYSMADTFNSMVKLGSQKKLGSRQIDLSKTPTKIMSKLLDHETWYNGEGIASPEEGDGGDGSNDITDSTKFYASQSIARIGILGTYKLTIIVPANPKLMVGQKVEVMLPNMVPGDEKTTQQYDEENSGMYLISHIQHRFDPTSGNSISQLSLMRDSMGMVDMGSNAK